MTASHPRLPAPVFQAPGSDPARPRLLLISYHFPPGDAVGALRWQKLALLAAERGWELDAVTLDPSRVARPDRRRLAELPPGTRVFGAVPRPVWADRVLQLAVRARAAGRALARGGRRGAAAPRADSPSAEPAAEGGAATVSRTDARWALGTPRGYARLVVAWLVTARDRGWADDAAAVAAAVVDPRVHRAVISCGPPHMAHDAARRVAEASGLPLVLDLRDPWSLLERVSNGTASPLYWQLAARHERRAVGRAALVVTNTEPSRRALAALYPAARDRIITVTNGYEDEPAPARVEDEGFLVAYAGSVYLDRDPRPLFRAAARVIRDLRLTPAQFRLEFIGSAARFGASPLDGLARAEGIGEHVAVVPRKPRAEALALLARASVLVSLPQDSHMAIPSKVFEYMPFAAWLLAMAEPESATGMLLAGSDADVVAPADEERLTRVLRARYEQWARGERPAPLAREERFSRRYQAGVLFDALERAAGGAAGGAAARALIHS